MEVEGIPGKLPPLATFPISEIRQTLPPEEWQACLDAWIFCVEFRLRLLPEHFHHFKLSQAASGVPFLSSYFMSWPPLHASVSIYSPKDGKEQMLHRNCLLLLRRLLLETDSPYDCSTRDIFILLANASAALISSSTWLDTMQQAWDQHEKLLSSAVEQTKSTLIELLAGGSPYNYEALHQSLYQVTALSKCLPQAGKIMMTGSDYVDSLTSSYHDLPVRHEALDNGDPKKLLAENLYVCLRSLMTSSNPSTSLLLDDLYILKSNTEAETKGNPNKQTLLSSLVCSTTFVRHLEIFLATASNSRGNSMLRFLRSYKMKMSYLHPVPEVSRRHTGKGKARSDHVVNEMHVHKAAQVSQIHELFPDTPSSYVLRLLEHFSNDVEAVTAALLEPESLPADIRDAKYHADDAEKEIEVHPALVPRSEPPPTRNRRNVFDDDDFDKLRISTSQIHVGRTERYDAETLNPSEKAKKKAAIMAALAAFDSDDDERDDSYDVADVGGAVDNTVDTDARPRARKPKAHEEPDVNEQTLFRAWKSNPELFARDNKTRMSQPRQQFKRETGMGDEQIEGWALMLSRDDTAAQKLEQKYVGLASFGGQQRALEVTRWAASRSETATEEDTDTDADGKDGPARGGASSRSRPFRGVLGNGRGRGSPSGPSGDASTQNARKRKEQGRGKGGANHNRWEGRARKMGRGFSNLPAS
jgi:activating signal cointegrator complex subunit 2